MYFERFSKDEKRGIIIPKGSLPSDKYVVSYQGSGNSEERNGADLMEKGITLEQMPI